MSFFEPEFFIILGNMKLFFRTVVERAISEADQNGEKFKICKLISKK